MLKDSKNKNIKTLNTKSINLFKNKILVQPDVQHGLAIAAAKIIGTISFLQHQLSLVMRATPAS